MPDRYAYLKWVNDVDNAMPWDKIDAARYAVWNKTEKIKQLLTVKLELQLMIN
jgi:carboxyl-terminal processing protease